jgi:hypothetical protein
MGLIKSIGEYLEAVKLGFENRDKIIEAMQVAAQVKNSEIGHNMNVTPEALAEIMRRKDICAACPFNSRHQKELGTYTSSLPYEHCTLCRCRIGYDDSKEYCLSCNCGADAWNQVKPPEQHLEVKWTAFTQPIE